jgi:hypothetical protein
VSGLGLRLRRIAFREGDDGRANGWRFQPPAVVQQPPRQARSPKLNGDDLPHDPTMRCRLAARVPGMFRICVFLCRFRAGGEARTKRYCGSRSPFKAPPPAMRSAAALVSNHAAHHFCCMSFRACEARIRNPRIPRCAIAHLRSGPSDHPGMTFPQVLPDTSPFGQLSQGSMRSRGTAANINQSSRNHD